MCDRVAGRLVQVGLQFALSIFRTGKRCYGGRKEERFLQSLREASRRIQEGDESHTASVAIDHHGRTMVAGLVR